MIVPGALSQKFALHSKYVELVGAKVRDIVGRHSDAHGYLFGGRHKGLESLVEKLESGRYQCWSDIDDLYACTIVMPSLGHESTIIEFLASRFETVQLKLRGTSLKDPSTFRFDATRFIGRLRTDPQLDDASPLRSVLFEVQIRTAFEHAWSAATHALTYKASSIDWRRLRLAAQLKASVEQLDQLLVGFEEAASIVAAHRWPELEAQRAIETFFKERFASGFLPAELEPQSWGRFCENLYALLLASTRTRVRDKEAFVAGRLAHLDAGLKSLTPQAIPRSLTVTQLSLGLLAENDEIVGPLDRRTPLLCEDLFAFFPKARQIGPGFDLEDKISTVAA